MFKKGKKTLHTDNLLTSVIDVSPLGMIVVRDKDGNAIITNKAAQKQMKEWDISKRDCFLGLESVFPKFKVCYEGLKNATFDIKDINGRTFEVTYKKIEMPNEDTASVFVFEDVGIRRETTKVLYDLAYRDYLTQIPNRLKLKEDFMAIEPEIASGEKEGIISIIDIDDFKGVNDAYGHNIGDMMLQKLTEHLQGDPSYAGHLYRLGGDEFALFYAEDAGTHKDIKEHYENLLSGVLNSYTLSSIDIACTVSIGASFFPLHGNDLFTLLRKADIALYKVKASGRNSLAMFEAEDDMAKDLKDLYVSIQPVLDMRGNTFGYELKDGVKLSEKDSYAVNLDSFNRTLDVLKFEDIASDNHYFINYSKNMLHTPLKDYLSGKFIIQISINSRCGEKELLDYKKLKALGYTLAVNCSNIEFLSPALLHIADYVKVIPYKYSQSAVLKLTLTNKSIIFIGDQINDSEQLAFAKNAGCSLFSGHYFKNAEPVTERIKDFEPLHANYYRLLKLTCTRDYVDFNEISDIISSDLAMSYRLLRLINSVGMGIKNKISTIPMALTYLGEESLKKWIALLCLRGITPDKPLELIRVSLLRAKFGENLAPHLSPPGSPEQVFMLGMLSLLHVALDKTQEELLDEISIADELRDSFLSRRGKYSGLLAFFKNYEHSNWDEVTRFAKSNNIDNKTINEAYIEATKWFGEMIKFECSDCADYALCMRGDPNVSGECTKSRSTKNNIM